MSALDWLQPREHGVAARAVSILTTVAAVVTIVFAIGEPGAKESPLAIAITVAVALVVAVASWMLRYVPATSELAWASCPFLAVAVIVTLDLLTADGSIAAQIFFFFPALYGASQLRWPGAAAVAAAAVLADIAVIIAVQPTRAGLIDGVYVCAALLTTSALLISAGRRQDALVEQLQHQAAIDPLTGLSTRRVLDQAAQSALAGAMSGEGSALILIDVDDFKVVNDQYGHPAGDEVLIQLAGVLVAGCRPNDIVSRLGGDEIALLLPGCSEQTLQRRADQILWDVRAHAFLLPEGEQISISVSAGLSHAPTHAHDLRTLYACADSSLYEAKRAGRNRVGATTMTRRSSDQQDAGHKSAQTASATRTQRP
jgi:diguanylate cyclase (GGDEF)-like protein